MLPGVASAPTGWVSSRPGEAQDGMEAQRGPGASPALQFLECVYERWGLLGGDAGFGARAF